MPIPWLAVLQSVPWTEVVKNAPKVAEGAKKLWGAVSRSSTPAEQSARHYADDLSAEQQTNAALTKRIVELNASVADLHTQMAASSELIKALADQNAQLVQRVDSLHRRIRWLSVCFAVALVAALVLWSQAT